jgi:hypothetical protein
MATRHSRQRKAAAQPVASVGSAEPTRRAFLHLADLPLPQHEARPPSTRSTVPVMKLAAGDAKNVMTDATSSGTPIRRSAVAPAI